MAIFIRCRKNTLPTCKAPYVINSSSSSSRTVDEFNKDLEARNAGQTLSEILAHSKLQEDELSRQLANGVNVHLPFGSFRLCASGTMRTVDEPFTQGAAGCDHELSIHFRVNQDFAARVALNAKVERKGIADASIPYLRSVASIRTHEAFTCPAGELVRIDGERLYFDETDLSTGIFLVGEVEIRADYYVETKPSSIIAEIPAGVPPGKYTIALRTLADDTTIREGRMQTRFTVTPAPAK